ncbi:sulfurtransferase [Nitrososphaera sp. AFS]|jgi:thiosulfate/3-mercaptopyruvate sulfurtransferase|nr:sulfurtransferase [Nitrososphaera sp. AFS]
MGMSSITVDAKWLASRLENPELVILDARGSIPYSFGHIKNAKPLGLEDVIRVSEEGASLVIDGNEAEKLFSAFGIDDSKDVIVYGEASDPSVGRVAWTLMYYGHRNVQVLAIGFSKWLQLGYPVTRDVPKSVVREASKANIEAQLRFKPKITESIRADAEYIKKRLEDPNVLFLDARTPQEHFQARIPGSILDNWEDGVGHAGEMLKGKSELEEDFERKGIGKESEIICFCHAGVRASHKYLQLKQAGYERVKVYDGSIIDWAKRGYPLR